MAFRILRAYGSLIKPIKNTFITNNEISQNVMRKNSELLKSVSPLKTFSRPAAFFTKYSAERLWKSVTGVSNAGRKRGRGKGVNKKAIRNLNRGQIIGVGKYNMSWPGLTTPVMRGNMVLKHQRLPDDPDREKNLTKVRDSMVRRKSRRTHPLERGWTSAKMGGKSIGPPDPIGDDKYENFDTIVLEHKMVTHMTGNMGRKKRLSTFVGTGNKNGLVGIALAKANEGKISVRQAKNRAGLRLIHVKRYKEHTVYHDFFAQFGKTKVFVSKAVEGYGLKCHRIIKAICELCGIKNLYAKVEGSNRPQHIAKAFLIGLVQQKTHQQLADEKQLHLVELRKEKHMYPQVVASPAVVRKREEIPSTEVMDFTQYVLGGKVVYNRKKYPPFYTKMKSWQIRLLKQEYLRNQDHVRLRMYAEHGELRSFLTDKYPEAKPTIWCGKDRKANEAE